MHQAAALVSQKVTTVIDTLDLDLAAEIEKDDDELDRLLADTFAATTADDCPFEGTAGGRRDPAGAATSSGSATTASRSPVAWSTW